MSTASRCVHDACGRFVTAGSLFCTRHQPARTDVLTTLSGQHQRVDPEIFRRRVARGDYRGLVDANIRTILVDAAEDMKANGLVDEAGALRMVLARLLVEETDLNQLTTNVTRIATAAVHTARAQALISGRAAEGLTEALTQILLEVAGADDGMGS